MSLSNSDGMHICECASNMYVCAHVCMYVCERARVEIYMCANVRVCVPVNFCEVLIVETQHHNKIRLYRDFHYYFGMYICECVCARICVGVVLMLFFVRFYVCCVVLCVCFVSMNVT